MSGKTFANISQKECVAAYKAVLEHSEKKWKSAKKLAEIGDFGGAVSYAIISIEELVKAVLLVVDSEGFEFRHVKGMDVFFRDHQIRYVVAYGMFVMGLFGEELMKFIRKAQENQSWAMELVNELKDDVFSNRKVERYFIRKYVLLKQELSWFARIDIFRQDGFYSDYDEHLKSPLNFTENDYKQIELRLSRVRLFAEEFVKMIINKEEPMKGHIQEMKAKFKKRDHYSLVRKLLEKIRQNNGQPFSILMEEFDNI